MKKLKRYIVKYVIILFVFALNETSVAQTDESFINQNLNLFSRYRLSVGYVSLLIDDSNFEFRHPFFNWSYRSSGFNKASSSFGVEFAFEPGVNGLIVSKILDDGSDFGFFFVPYAKLGPEMRFGKNTFVAASAGFILVTYEKFFPLPFLGLNNFYLIPLNEKLNIEVEAGFHTTFSHDNLPLLTYINIGISFN